MENQIDIKEELAAQALAIKEEPQTEVKLSKGMTIPDMVKALGPE